MGPAASPGDVGEDAKPRPEARVPRDWDNIGRERRGKESCLSENDIVVRGSEVDVVSPVCDNYGAKKCIIVRAGGENEA